MWVWGLVCKLLYTRTFQHIDTSTKALNSSTSWFFFLKAHAHVNTFITLPGALSHTHLNTFVHSFRTPPTCLLELVYISYIIWFHIFSFFKLCGTCDFILYIQQFFLFLYAHKKTRVVVVHSWAAAVLMGGTRSPHTCRRRNQTASATFVHDRPEKCGKTRRPFNLEGL